jgi:CDP-paratose 2-epimerase
MKKKIENSIIIITGSAGLVGSESVKFFSEKGYKVVGIDNNQRKKLFGIIADTDRQKKKLLKTYNNYEHYNTDITKFSHLIKIFIKYGTSIKLVIHCAAQPSHDWAYRDPFLDFHINATGTLNMLEAIKKYSPSSKFILMSTNKVYGDSPNKLPLIEKKLRWELNIKHKYSRGIGEKMSIDNSTHSLFGVSKSYADLITQEYGKNFNLNTIVFRAGCITGPNHSGAKLHGFLSYLVKACIRYKKYTLIGYKGKQVRDNIHSHDLVNCFWQYFKNSKFKGEVYNIGGGRFSNCSILESIKYIESRLKIKLKKIFQKKPRVGDHKWYITDNSKFKKHYPMWKQLYNTKKILDDLINCELNKIS